MSKLNTILSERGTAANNGDYWIERPIDGGYDVLGPAVCQSFWSWDQLIRWASDTKVDVTRGWQKTEKTEDN